MHAPLVSVVMPVYNGKGYLVDAVASIIGQTLSDWELICVDDGSTDQSGDVLDWFADQDRRIRVVHQANSGIVDALNQGLSLARAPLICRMDCDDVAMLNRLERQAIYMRHHAQSTVVGSAILEIDHAGDPLCVSSLPAEHEDILDRLLHRRTGHFHPTTMIRAAALEAVGGYRRQYQWVEDHDLWLRLAQRGTLANLPDTLLCYRQHAGSVCWQKSAQQRELMDQLLQEAYAARGRAVPQEVLLATSPNRTPAGPGKWARAAARGGYSSSTWKHLTELWNTNADWQYKTRMSLEVGLRLSVSQVRNFWNRQPTPVPPRFPQWHQRVNEQFANFATVRLQPSQAA